MLHIVCPWLPFDFVLVLWVFCLLPQSSNSISPPHPPEPGLTLSSTLHSDLSTISDLLAWARECGYRKVTSYTEADLANRFVIRLAEGGTGQEPCVSLVSITVWVTWIISFLFSMFCFFKNVFWTVRFCFILQNVSRDTEVQVQQMYDTIHI